MQPGSTTGLSTRTASVLAYLGWWVTGLIFWGVEREDALVRFHAIQSTLTFGGLGLVIVGCAGIALVMLSYAPSGFTFFLWLALGLWVASVALWMVAIWMASRGRKWRIPLASRVAESWSRVAG